MRIVVINYSLRGGNMGDSATLPFVCCDLYDTIQTETRQVYELNWNILAIIQLNIDNEATQWNHNRRERDHSMIIRIRRRSMNNPMMKRLQTTSDIKHAQRSMEKVVRRPFRPNTRTTFNLKQTHRTTLTLSINVQITKQSKESIQQNITFIVQ